MLLASLFLASSSPLFVESAVSYGICPRHQWGSETTEESWNCSYFGVNSCTKTTRSCSFNGRLEEKSGVNEYDWDGQLIPPTLGGEGWDCRNYFKHLRLRIYNFKHFLGTTATTVVTPAVAVEQQSHHEQDLLSQVRKTGEPLEYDIEYDAKIKYS